MSTEARAPGEDAEALARELERKAQSGEAWPVDPMRIAATLRDLSRKLDDYREDAAVREAERDEWMERAEAAEAALEEARRERDYGEMARRFHETYERLAPAFGYRTREESAVPWEDVPEHNRALMEATCREVMVQVRAVARRALSPQTEEPETRQETDCPECGATLAVHLDSGRIVAVLALYPQPQEPA